MVLFFTKIFCRLRSSLKYISYEARLDIPVVSSSLYAVNQTDFIQVADVEQIETRSDFDLGTKKNFILKASFLPTKVFVTDLGVSYIFTSLGLGYSNVIFSSVVTNVSESLKTIEKNKQINL